MIYTGENPDSDTLGTRDCGYYLPQTRLRLFFIWSHRNNYIKRKFEAIYGSYQSVFVFIMFKFFFASSN